MTTVITMRPRTKNMMMTSRNMKIISMKTKIMMMKTMTTKITMTKIMMMKTKTTMTMKTMITEEEEEEDQETETSKETAREDLLPEAAEAVLVEDPDVAPTQDQEEEEIPEVPDQEEEAGQIPRTQTMIAMTVDTIIREGQEEVETVAEDLQGQALAQIPIQIQADLAQDQEITAVQVEVLIQGQVQDHQEEVSLQ